MYSACRCLRNRKVCVGQPEECVSAAAGHVAQWLERARVGDDVVTRTAMSGCSGVNQRTTLDRPPGPARKQPHSNDGTASELQARTSSYRARARRPWCGTTTPRRGEKHGPITNSQPRTTDRAHDVPPSLAAQSNEQHDQGTIANRSSLIPTQSRCSALPIPPSPHGQHMHI